MPKPQAQRRKRPTCRPPAAAHQATYFFKNSAFEYVLLTSLGRAYHQGGNVGKVLSVIRQIEDGNFESAYQAMVAAGNEACAMAEDSAGGGYIESARQTYLWANDFHDRATYFADGTGEPARIAAAIAEPGVIDVSTSWTATLPPPMLELLKAGRNEEFDDFMTKSLDPATKNSLVFRMRPHGTKSYYEAFKATLAYNLTEVIGRIECPMLLTEPSNEAFWPGQSRRLYDLLKCPKTLVPFSASDGVDPHCEPKGYGLRDLLILIGIWFLRFAGRGAVGMVDGCPRGGAAVVDEAVPLSLCVVPIAHHVSAIDIRGHRSRAARVQQGFKLTCVCRLGCRQQDGDDLGFGKESCVHVKAGEWSENDGCDLPRR